MKINKLIKILEAIRDNNGDIEVCIYDEKDKVEYKINRVALASTEKGLVADIS